MLPSILPALKLNLNILIASFITTSFNANFFILRVEIVVQWELTAAQALEDPWQTAVAGRGEGDQGAGPVLVLQVSLVPSGKE